MNSRTTDTQAGVSGEIDSFLTNCLRCALRSEPMPIWPQAWQDMQGPAIKRMTFHGIALYLGVTGAALADWPPEVVHEIKKTAALVNFWESSHKDAVVVLLGGFAKAGIPVVITKGTAFAYSIYPQPALRRRGDTDIVVLTEHRGSARKVLRSCGFKPEPDPRALQEDWHYDSSIGIRHAVDIHWRLNASATISRLLEQGTCFSESFDLPKLGPGARAMGPVGNLILTCVNRHSHASMGYYIGDEKLFETERLIWALDIYLLAGMMDDRAWRELAQQARLTETASIILSGLQFAQRALGAPIPQAIIATLNQMSSAQGVANYFAMASGPRRLSMDLSASPRLRDKARLLLRVMVPSDVFLLERFPKAQRWPRPALHLRRWIEGAAKLAQGKG